MGPSCANYLHSPSVVVNTNPGYTGQNSATIVARGSREDVVCAPLGSEQLCSSACPQHTVLLWGSFWIYAASVMLHFWKVLESLEHAAREHDFPWSVAPPTHPCTLRDVLNVAWGQCHGLAEHHAADVDIEAGTLAAFACLCFVCSQDVWLRTVLDRSKLFGTVWTVPKKIRNRPLTLESRSA